VAAPPRTGIEVVTEGAHGEARFRREQHDFDALFRAHHAEIVRYLAARLGSRDEALDVASEVFVAAWRRAPGLRYRGRPITAWLYRVAANMAADHMSARRRELPAAEAGDAVGVADEAAAVAERDALRRALATLPPDHALAVHLRLVEGYSFADVARVMGRSVGACQMLVLRAGRDLQRALEREGIHAPQ
jgi:RNA polymerase sigma-70 factor (ECF subfamily)